MNQQERPMVEGPGGWHAWLGTPEPPTSGQAQLLLENGQPVLVPAKLLSRRDDGSYWLPLSLLGPQPVAAGESVVLPVVEEQATVSKALVEAGKTVVHVVPTTKTRVIDVPLMEEDVEIERVPVNRVVAEPGGVRQEGDVTVVPVFEEILVVERRLMLKEEVRIRRRQTVRREQHAMEVRTEEVHVLRSDNPNRAAAAD